MDPHAFEGQIADVESPHRRRSWDRTVQNLSPPGPHALSIDRSELFLAHREPLCALLQKDSGRPHACVSYGRGTLGHTATAFPIRPDIVHRAGGTSLALLRVEPSAAVRTSSEPRSPGILALLRGARSPQRREQYIAIHLHKTLPRVLARPASVKN
ncbi:hypothetical protein BC628DRAFT_1380983 [Trametes gibbosa]|nr:hypothetical protein BC628DRAFT_1380983 [Trametes gibbosa]